MIKLQQIKSLLGIFIPFFLCLCLGAGEAQAENLWQLISAAKSQSVTSYFNENPSVNVIWTYDNQHWSGAINPNDTEKLARLSVSSVDYSFISSLEHGRSYWIQSAELIDVPLKSTSSTEPSTYDVGYHLICGTGDSVSSFLERHPEVSRIWSWDTGSRRFKVVEQGVFIQYEGTTKFQQLDAERSYWIKVDFPLQSFSLQNMPFGMTNHAAAITPQGQIYAHGGISSGEMTNLMLAYSISENNWSSAPSSILSRSDHTMVHHDGFLYVWGGKNSTGTPLNNLEAFDLQSRQWLSLESGGTPRYAHSAVVYNEKIYFWGGISNSAPFVLNSLDIYDINSAKWIPGISGGTARAKHRAAILDKKMLIIGGSNGDLDQYNLETESWQLSKGPKVDRQAFGLGKIDNQIFVTGGVDNNLEIKNNHLIIDSGIRISSSIRNLKYPRSNHQSMYYEGKLYSLGGQNSFGQELSSVEILVLNPLSNQQFNQSPEIRNVRISGSGSEVAVIFDVIDIEGDFNLKIDLEYSLDNGQSWLQVLGLTAQNVKYLPGKNQLVTWNTLADFGTDQREVKLRLKANDGQSYSRDYEYSEPFLIDNGKPLVKDVDVLSTLNSGIVSFTFDVSDIDEDLLNIKLEYSLDGGLNYLSANKISGATLGIDSSPHKPQSYSTPSLLYSMTSSNEVVLEPVSINDEKIVLLDHNQLKVYDTRGLLYSSTQLSDNSTFLYAPVVRKDGLILTVSSNNELLGFYPDSSLVLSVTFESEVIDNVSLDQHENLFVVTRDGKLSKLDYHGNLVYSQQMGTNNCSRPVPFDNSVVLVCDTLRIISLSNETGEIEFDMDLNESSLGVIGHPIIDNSGRVLISYENGDFEVLDSTLKSITYHSNLGITSLPLLDHDNRAYLANSDGRILRYEGGVIHELFSSGYNHLKIFQLVSSGRLLLTSNDGTQGLFNTSGERLIQYDTDDGVIKPLIMKNSVIHVAGTTVSFHEGLGVSLLNSAWSREGANNRNSMNVVDSSGKNTLKSGSRYKLEWHSTEDFLTDEDNVRVRISAADDNGYSENYGISDLFSVNNGENSTPAVAYLFVKNLSGKVEVITKIDDLDGDKVNLSVEFSLDAGTSFKKATIDAESISNLDTSTEVKFFWNSSLDINQDISSVVLRISADDGGLGSSNIITSTNFALYNHNNAPRIDNLDITGERGVLTISVAGVDVEQDLSELIFEFSVDGNEFKSISPANLEGPLSNLTSPFTTQIKWFSNNDISNLASYVILRVVAFDGKEKGVWKKSSPFVIDNSGDWQSHPITNRRAYVAGTADTNYAYFWGGRIDGDYTNILERIDPETLQIDSLRAGGQERIGATINHVNGKLYVYGGQTKLDNCLGAMCNIPSNDLDVYTVATNSWLSISNETIARSDHSAVNYEDRIYIFGGQGEQGLLNSLICFDPSTNSWTSLSSGAEPRYGHTAFVHENRMFIWGGLIDSSEGTINSLNSMWSYDFNTDEWLHETPGGTPRAFHSVVTFDGKAYFWGGFKVATLAENFILFEDQNSVLNTLDLFDLDSRTWSLGKSGGTGRVTHGASKVNDKLIYWGGLNQDIEELGSVDIYTALSTVTTSINSMPEVTSFSVGNYRGNINLTLFIEDQENDLVNLEFELSVDGGKTYELLNEHHLQGDLEEISTPSSVVITWLSRNDIRQNIPFVRIRVTPKDGNSGESRPIVSEIFEVKNDYSNQPPEAENIRISGIRNDIAIQVDLKDSESDLLDIEFEYSIDGGLNWLQTRNISGPVSEVIVPSTQSYIWHSGGCNSLTTCTAESTDISMSSTEVKLRVIPSDQGIQMGKSAESDIFSVLNSNRLPYTQILEISGEKHDVVVRFDAVDQDGDILDYIFQYSLDAGASWTTSDNVVGLTSGVPSLSKTITWRSLQDIFRDRLEVMVRIIPKDFLGAGFAIPSNKFSLTNENWSTGISLLQARRGHSTTLYDQRIYIWGGMDETGNVLNTLDIYDLRTGSWIRGASGGRARANHTAIANSGYIYFWGGQDGGGNINTLDIYDIDNMTWTFGTSGGNARRGHTASIYNNKIYYWGGTGFTNVLNTLDIYDISQDFWEVGQSGGRARSEHSSIVDGSKVIFWGGMDSNIIVNTMDIYDIANDEWQLGVSGGQARSGHTANTLGRRMIVWGGSNLGVYNTIDVFNLDNYTWSTGDSGGIASEQHTAVQLDDKIMFFGGAGTEGFVKEVITYQDPERTIRDDLSEVDQIYQGNNGANINRQNHGSVSYRKNIYVWGGLESALLSSLEIYDSKLDQWILSTPGGTPRTGFVMDIIKGKIIITGGTNQSGQVTNEVDVFNINSGVWTSGSRDAESRRNHAGVTYNGRLYLWGGEDQNGDYVDSLDIYESATDNWFRRTGGGRVRSHHCASQHEGKIYFWGGQDKTGTLLNSLDIYDINSNVWIEGTTGGLARKHSSCISFEGKIYFIGGETSSGIVSGTVDVFDIDTNTWSGSKNNLIFRRKHFTATLVDQNLYLWGGVDHNETLNSQLDIYRMPTSTGALWSEGPTGGVSRAFHSSVNADGRMISWGGLTESGVTNSVEIFDLKNNSYSTAISGGTSRWDHTATLYEGRVYHWGGTDGETIFNTMDILTVPTVGVQWLTGIASERPRYGHGSEHYQGKIYVLGGQDENEQFLETVDIFEISSQSWSIGATLPSPRSLFTTVRSGRFLYLIGGNELNGTLSDILAYDTANQTVFLKDLANRPRHSHASVLLDERIYTFGGKAEEGVPLRSAEIYILNTKVTTEIEDLQVSRFGHSASLVGRKIYIWGGESFDGLQNTMEIYDVDKGTWTSGTSGGTARKYHTAKVVGDQIFFFGGNASAGSEINTVDIYHALTDSWSHGPSGGQPRSHHSSVLEAGKIYHVGGTSLGTAISSMDIFIPEDGGSSLSSSVWTIGQTGGNKREKHSSLVYEDKIYHWGGLDEIGSPSNTLAVYDTHAKTWSTGHTGGTSRHGHQGFAHKDKLYFHGGSNSQSEILSSIDIYKPEVGQWVKGINGGDSRTAHSIVVSNGSVFSWGGINPQSGVVNTMDIYDIDTWYKGSAGGDSRADHNAAVYDGKMYIFSGFGNGINRSTVNIYDIDKDVWFNGPINSTPRTGASACMLDSDTLGVEKGIYIWGGIVGIDIINVFEVLNVEEEKFNTGAIGGTKRFFATATCDSDRDKIYLWGGKSASNIATNHLDIYSPKVPGSYSSGTNGGTPRFGHTASYHDGKIYIWGGRINTTQRVNTMDIYDVVTDSWSQGPSGGTPRSDHSAIVFNDKIYFYGGSVLTSEKKLDTLDVFDIVKQEWQEGPESRYIYEGSSTEAQRSGHTAIEWEGKMYVWGGRGNIDNELNTLDVMDLQQWRQGSGGGTARYNHSGIAFDEKIYFWGGTDGVTNLNTMDIYDIRSDSWSTGTAGGDPRQGHSAIYDQGNIFFWGGVDSTGNKFLNTLDVYEIASAGWITGFFGGTPRVNHTAVKLGNEIYHWGGRDGSGLLNSTDIYSVISADNLWQQGSSGGTSRKAHTATLVDNKIYFWGGVDGQNELLNTIDIYDLENSTWSGGTAGGIARKNHNASEDSGLVYFWGGVDANGHYLTEMDIYDTSNDLWLTGNNGGMVRQNHSQINYHSQQFIWGGKNSSGNSNILESYDLETQSWRRLVMGGRARSGHSEVIRNGKIYFWGGETSSGNFINTMDIAKVGSQYNNAPKIDSILMAATPDANGYRDSVTMSLAITDADMDFVSLIFEYSTDGGESWNYIDSNHFNISITNIRPASNFTITWRSLSDLPLQVQSLLLKVTPTDSEALGTPITVEPIKLNNEGSWITRSSGPNYKSKMDFVIRNDNQFVVWGGEDSNREESNTQAIYNVNTGVWSAGTSGENFAVARAEHTSIMAGSRIYHWGGRLNGQFLNSFAVYDVLFDIWRLESAASGGTARAAHTVNHINNKMYVWGGEGSEGFLNSLEYYDFKNDSWVSVTNGGTPRRGHSSVYYNNKLYLFGGESGSNQNAVVTDLLEIYDMSTGQWTNGLASGVPLVNHRALIEGDRMWVWGGSKENGIYSNDLYIYDFKANTWTKGPSGGTARKYHAAASNNGVLYFYGGWNGSVLRSMDSYSIAR